MAEARTWLSQFRSRYPEASPAAIALGVGLGVLLNMAVTYTGLKMGITMGVSATSAVLGFGILRGLLRRGTILETNIVQTLGSAVCTCCAGVIFTVPAFFLLQRSIDPGLAFDPYLTCAAAMAGAVLGVAFVIPIRKRMIELDRLQFPEGTAVAMVLRAPGAGARKTRVLVIGVLVGACVYFFTKSHLIGIPGYGSAARALGIPGVTHEYIDVGRWLKFPASMQFIWAIAPISVGGGYIAGLPGMVVLAGGVLAYMIINPTIFKLGWTPPGVEETAVADWARDHINRPIGIGMLLGGALIGVALTAPAMVAAMRGMRGPTGPRAGRAADELSVKWLMPAIVLAFVVLLAGAELVSARSFWSNALIALLGTAWIWFAGIIIAQCNGMTNWSPVSGMALLTIVGVLALSGNEIVTAITLGAAVCVAVTEASDMMQDLKTGHMVGARPIRQQLPQLCVSWVGVGVTMAVLFLLVESNRRNFNGIPIGSGTDMPAPQAMAVQNVVQAVVSGNVPTEKYALGAIIGVLLSLSGLPSLGVLVGLSMYLNFYHILPYGLGCVLHLVLKRVRGRDWHEDVGVPFAAGLLVGEPLVALMFAILTVAGIVGN